MAQYSIEVSLYWLLGWGLYRVALQEERFFALNRAYLLLTLLGGLLLPLPAQKGECEFAWHKQCPKGLPKLVVNIENRLYKFAQQ